MKPGPISNKVPGGMELLVPATDDVGKADDAVRVLLKSWRLRFDSDGDNYKSIITSGTMEALHGVDVSWIHKPKGAQRHDMTSFCDMRCAEY